MSEVMITLPLSAVLNAWKISDAQTYTVCALCGGSWLQDGRGRGHLPKCAVAKAQRPVTSSFGTHEEQLREALEAR